MLGDGVEDLVDRLGGERQDLGLNHGLRLERVGRKGVMDHPPPVLEVDARRGVVSRHQVEVRSALSPRHVVGNRIQQQVDRALLKAQGRDFVDLASFVP